MESTEDILKELQEMEAQLRQRLKSDPSLTMDQIWEEIGGIDVTEERLGTASVYFSKKPSKKQRGGT